MVLERRKLIIAPISPAAPGALYEQIVEGVKREISAGRLLPGAPLPSFRDLAQDLLVSLITVKRAYEELEREGIIYRKQGLGTFVAENGDVRSRAIHRGRAEQAMREAVRAGLQAGMSGTELKHMLRRVLEEEGHE